MRWGGLAAIRATLSRVGIDVGDQRFTLLSALTLGVTVVLLFAGVRLVNRVLAHLIAGSRGFDPTQKLLVQKLSGIAVLVLAFFVGIDLLRIDLTAFAVFSGAFGLAIGFGLQKTIGNLIAGIILLMDRSIKPGDVIVVGDSFGWVNKIGVRAVSVITRDGKEHLIPNENLMTQEVENWSYTDRNVRVRIPVHVAYSCDLELAQALMLQAAAESPRVLETPPPERVADGVRREWGGARDPRLDQRSRGRGRQCPQRRAQPAVAAVQGGGDRDSLPPARRAGEGMGAPGGRVDRAGDQAGRRCRCPARSLRRKWIGSISAARKGLGGFRAERF